MAARPVADRPEYQQVNRIGRDGAALKGGWTFLVNITTRTVLRTVGDPDDLDFENGDVVHISENTNRALQTHKTALDGANEWLRARLADDGLELVDQG